jgi:hypothetical protein
MAQSRRGRKQAKSSVVRISSGRLWRSGIPAGDNRSQREDNCGGSSARVIEMCFDPEEVNQVTDNVVYIYDRLKRWWADRRIKEWLVAAFIVGLSLGVLIGLVAGHVLAISS